MRHFGYIRVFASLIVQIITGILNIGVAAFDFKAFTFSDESKILVKLLWLAIFVQIIEGIFYVWLANSFDFVIINGLISIKLASFCITIL